PTDGAAGEGFTNTGQSLVMSPALLGKYLDAAKEIAAHAVLLPTGIRFSPSTTKGDWTNEILKSIRDLYAEHSAAQGGTQVNLQGIVFSTNEGGRLALDRYIGATIRHRQALESGQVTPQDVARQEKLNPRYLASLWKVLEDREPSPLLDQVRQRWRNAKESDIPALLGDIDRWQKALTRFQNVGHMKSWMAAVNPLTTRQELRFKIPPTTADQVSLYLAAGDAGDGASGDVVIWQQARLTIPGRPDLPLREVGAFSQAVLAHRQRLFTSTAKCLAAAAEASQSSSKIDVAGLARKHGTEPVLLQPWLELLGIGSVGTPRLAHLTDKTHSTGGYDFAKGYGKAETPNLVANSSDRHVRIPGNLKPHGLVVHPSPTLSVGVGWQCPVEDVYHVSGTVTHAHPECGNGVTWALELRRGGTRQRLAAGVSHGSKPVPVGPFPQFALKSGDLLSLLIGPRDGNHACDLTDVDLVLRSTKLPQREWKLTRDVTSDIHAGNPHADRFGNNEVWHFYTEPVSGSDSGTVIPAGSLLSRWIAAGNPQEKAKLADQLQALLIGKPPVAGSAPGKVDPDALLYQQLNALGGPLLSRFKPDAPNPNAAPGSGLGLDADLFGKHPDGSTLDANTLAMKAPGVLQVRLPGGLFEGAELFASAVLDPRSGSTGSVQVQISGAKPDGLVGLRADLPVLVGDSDATRARWTRAFDAFRKWFPAALAYTKIVPVDEVVTLTLYHREDEALSRLMLDDKQKARLDQLWEELHFVSRDALTLVDAFKQLMEYATQDSDPKLFEPFRKPIHDRAEAFKKALVAAEPRHLEAVIELADRAYRRPLQPREREELQGLYRKLREQGLAHEEAIRLTLARVFVSPAFLYRLEQAPGGAKPAPVSELALANRLSYFLTSSMPDAELRELALSGKLNDPEVLVAQGRRLLKDDRVRRLATEFGCQWLHVYDFDKLDEKSERHFPTFVGLRGDIYEETIRFLTDFFQKDGSVLGLLDADHTFLNENLAKHYGIAGVSGPEWRRVEGMRKQGRGGILGLSSTLAKQSGASRTSPILRGNWVSEVLLGEKLPKPPKNVPQLPEDEANVELTQRQLVEKHSSDPRCAVCHVRIDAFGFSLESFDAIGRFRTVDLGNRKIDTKATFKDGTVLEGLAGLRDYLVNKRRADFVKQFCRKLLGYALARGVQLSDEPLVEEMLSNLEKNGWRISAAIDTILRSPQFRMIRGRDRAVEESH
ncbi:MAG: DUF1592 domain-containing protein, partial [Gemmataceae bacterium]